MRRPLSEPFLDKVAEKFRMLGDPTRLSILQVLMAGEKNVGTVVSETGQSQANVSKHLKMLAEAGMVCRRKEGLQVFYRVDDPLIEQLCTLVCGSILDEAQVQFEKTRELLETWKGS